MRVPAVCASPKNLEEKAARHGPVLAPSTKGCESRRHLIRFVPPVYGLWHCFTHSSCICNDIIACFNRVVGKVPLPTAAGVRLVRKEILHFQRKIGTLLPLTLEETLSTFKGAKNKLYKRAYDSLLVEPFGDKDGRIKSFVKAEKFNPLEKVNPDPRMIQARDPRYNLHLAAYLRGIEHFVYGLTVGGVKCVAKCLNPAQRYDMLAAKWAMFKDPVCFSVDATRFDKHVASEMLDVEHDFYESCYPGDPFLKRLLKYQKLNVCTTNNGLRYTVKGMRMSGDMNTGLGNILLMIAMLLAALHHLLVKAFQLMDDGDDCLVVTERSDFEKLRLNLPKVFLSFGQELKIENVAYDIRDVVFCQSKPTWNGDRYVFARNWRKVLSQSCCGTKHWNDPKMVRPLFGLIGDCELATHGGIPILEPYAIRLQQLSNGARARLETLDSSYQYRVGSWGLDLSSVKPKGITWKARLEFERTWGVSIVEQMAIEDTISRWDPDIFCRDVAPELVPWDWEQRLDPSIPNPTVL